MIITVDDVDDDGWDKIWKKVAKEIGPASSFIQIYLYPPRHFLINALIIMIYKESLQNENTGYFQ